MMDHAACGLATARDRARTGPPGKFGNASSGTLIAFSRTKAGRKARTISATQNPQPKSKHASGCVAKRRDHQAWSARKKIEVQNSTCVERQKEARICIGMQDGIPDDQ
ncbi:hypothetical protein JQ621_23080 [Bradyrhizobium manausense]|uniref:hypothetical protein n=1 Tax=Bradyrhizobium manausense TaxID=989370 RepID=UPI001BACBD87|nr:hypothetical protein [Bradyrhizobium manausense]MBR1090360.1 hypothetical protein [Bradyrhizobium manausense]